MAVSIGLIYVNVVKPGKSISEKTRMELVENYSGNTAKYKEQANKQKESGPLQALVELVPSNIFNAASNNRNMLQVIFFCHLFWRRFNSDRRKIFKTSKRFF